MTGAFQETAFQNDAFQIGGVPPPPIFGIVIRCAGVNITSAVLFSSARFESAVNGVAGSCHLRIRDPDRTRVILPGASLQLLIDDEPVWVGFAQQVKRVYVFPALDPEEFETRFIDIEGADLNLLFAKRIVFNADAPENVLAPLYGPNTPDTTAIADLFADWLDLTGDGLDTTTLIDNVGDINENQDARAWEGSDTWGQAFTSINALPAAVWYIRPTREVVWADVDQESAPFGLSDQPDGITSKGYSRMEILHDGSNLANDVLCWGIGFGTSTPVFERAEDATSQDDHGLWQLGQVTFGVYKQATIERIADSILNGSPSSHRGQKDDRVAVMVTTYERGLLPADRVNFESNVFGFSDVIPIRKMVVTFDAPDTPKYELTLSHEIDTPWSFFDPWRFHLPGFNLPPFPGFQIPNCGITDTFGRITIWNPHYYSGSIFGIAGPAPIGDKTYKFNGGPAIYEPSTTYDWEVVVLFNTMPGTTSFGGLGFYDYQFPPTLTMPALAAADIHTDDPPGTTTTGTFTTGGGVPQPLIAALTVIHNDVRDVGVTASFWLDPVGFVPDSGGWGTSDSSLVWETLFGGTFVDGTAGVLLEGGSVRLNGLTLTSIDMTFLVILEDPGQFAIYPSANTVVLLDVAAGEVTATRTTGDVSVTETFAFVAGTPYAIRIVDSEDETLVNVWEPPAAQPGTWLVTNTEFDPDYACDSLTFTSIEGTVRVMNLSIAGVNACTYFAGEIGPPPTPPGIPGNTNVCQNFVSDGTDVVTLGTAFLPASAVVYLNGLIQRHTTDFTEQPFAGTITFVTPPLAGDRIQVCIWSLPGSTAV
jgi:hypothetical protein